jgi:polysaccharide biosynthesis protein PslH
MVSGDRPHPLPVRDNRRAIILCSYVRPLTPRSGEQIRVNAMLRALADLHAPVYAFIRSERDMTISVGRGIVQVRQANLPWPRFARNPSDYWRINLNLVEAIAKLARQEPIRAAILDYGFLGQYVRPIRRLGVPVVIDTHNAQADVTRLVPVRSLAHRGILAMTHRVECWHERRFFPRADAIICVSREDRDYHARFIDPAKIYVVPNFIETPTTPASLSRRNRIIMTGSFTNFQNLEGARWFLEHVWDKELADQTSFCLAGRGSIEALARLGRYPNVSALGECDDIHKEIASSICAVVPIFHASGTRFKCIEAMSLGTPLVSTTRGVEGLQHDRAVAVADTPATFRREILYLINDRRHHAELASRGHAVFMREYSLDANVPRLARLFNTLR